jgi:hypothetical protein
VGQELSFPIQAMFVHFVIVGIWQYFVQLELLMEMLASGKVSVLDSSVTR